MNQRKRAPAKINLGLHVLGRRPDGYHDIETILLQIPWADVLTAGPAEQFTFTCSDAALPTDEGNLCVQAARRLAEACNMSAAGASLHLEKQIPYGAGLGGGSSDAAATLELLADLWQLSISAEQLAAIAARIGSDVPFFLGAPAAYATGRGEQVAPLYEREQTYRPPFALVVAVPAVQVSTVSAYRWVQPASAGRPDLQAVVRSNDLARWRRELVNDFQEPVMERYPAVRDLREQLVAAGAGYAALSGSGSAVFGAFEADTAARQAARRLAEEPDRCVQYVPPQ